MLGKIIIILFFLMSRVFLIAQIRFTPLANKQIIDICLNECFYDTLLGSAKINNYIENHSDCLKERYIASLIKFKKKEIKKDIKLLNKLNLLYYKYLDDQDTCKVISKTDTVIRKEIIYFDSPNLLSACYLKIKGSTITDIAIFIKPTNKLNKLARKNNLDEDYLFSYFSEKFVWWNLNCPIVHFYLSELTVLSGSVKTNYFMLNAR